MTTRRVLRGVVNDLAVSFVGRSNDHSGYWAVGLLRSFADEQGIQEIGFDLLAGDARPQAALTKSVSLGYAAWMRQHLARIALPLERVTRAELTVEFHAYDGTAPPPQITWGEPFICSVRLVDDRGRNYRRVLSSWCGPHDSSREWRRATEHHGLAGYH
jgi:hypothetical protein